MSGPFSRGESIALLNPLDPKKWKLQRPQVQRRPAEKPAIPDRTAIGSGSNGHRTPRKTRKSWHRAEKISQMGSGAGRSGSNRGPNPQSGLNCEGDSGQRLVFSGMMSRGGGKVSTAESVSPRGFESGGRPGEGILPARFHGLAQLHRGPLQIDGFLDDRAPGCRTNSLWPRWSAERRRYRRLAEEVARRADQAHDHHRGPPIVMGKPLACLCSRMCLRLSSSILWPA